MNNSSRLIIVGGFLGAGKTTLLGEVAQRISKTGKKVGLITNDQAPELVDTAFLMKKKMKVAEVSGSCFCCNYHGLFKEIEGLQKEAHEIILAEPVGSCTDLSATILQPLLSQKKKELFISPLTVMADPVPLTDILYGGDAGLHPGAVYILVKQLEESDIILINKSDLLDAEELDVLKEKVKERFAHAEIMTASTVTGEGIEEWLSKVLVGTDAGRRIVEVDYDLYAKGEAVLGWLNTSAELTGDSVEWDLFTEELMKDLSRRLEEVNATVGHIKILIEAGNLFRIGNLTGRADTLNFRGSVGCQERVLMTLNARAQMSPEKLEKIVRSVIQDHCGEGIEARIAAFKCLSPSRPTPTYRFNHTVIW